MTVKSFACILGMISITGVACSGLAVFEDSNTVSLDVSLSRLEAVQRGYVQSPSPTSAFLVHSFLTLCEPYSASATASLVGERIRVELTTRAGPHCDPRMASMFAYRASISIPREFPPPDANYNWSRFRTVHRYTDGRRSDSTDIEGTTGTMGPPLWGPAVTIRGRLEPADGTISPDQVVLYFVSSPADSTCTPDPGWVVNYPLGSAVSDRGDFEGTVRNWEGSPRAVCIHVYGQRDRERVRLSEQAVRVDFDPAPTNPLDASAIMPSGPGSWERRWRP